MAATDTASCSRFLDKLAEMVPAKYFIDSGKAQSTGSQFWHSKSVKAQMKQQAANEGKLRKRQKFDPENAKSTVDAQREVFEGKKRQHKGNGRGRAAAAADEEEIDEGELQFQKLEFNVKRAGTSAEDATQAKRKKTKQALLKDALKKKELAEGDKAGGNQVAWEKAFDRADGKKVFDDPKKLQKAIKREKKQKEK